MEIIKQTTIPAVIKLYILSINSWSWSKSWKRSWSWSRSKSRRRKALTAAVGAALLLAGAACSSTSSGSGSGSGGGGSGTGTITLGEMGPLTGPRADIGAAMVQGSNMALSVINADGGAGAAGRH